MWLDRLGANPPPSGFDSRPNSPVPRRQALNRSASSPYIVSQQRSARASSSTLVSSNDTGSTTSLLRSASHRGANGGAGGGSSLRQSHTVDDGSESLGVLGRILGEDSSAAENTAVPRSGSASPDSTGANRSMITEEDIEGDFDFGGLSLKEFVARGHVDDVSSEMYRSQTVEECTCTHFMPFSLSMYIELSL